MTSQPPADVQFRNYRAEDEKDIVALWNICLVRDEISLNTFRRKIILDPNFDTGGCFVAHSNGRPVGFALGLRRRYPYYDLGLEPGKGWITVFFVHPEFRRRSIASRLLEQVEGFLKSHQARELFVADYTPNYFIPGVDLDAYHEGYALLKARGYRSVEKVYGMGRSLMDLSMPEEFKQRAAELHGRGFSITVFNPRYILKTLEFLRKNYPGDLYRVAHDRMMEDPECDEMLLALKDEEVIGFSHFLDERFGPFGIAPKFAGRGFGPLLYYATVEQMRKKGRRNLWLAWTSGRAKDFYYKVGLRVTRRHIIMARQV